MPTQKLASLLLIALCPAPAGVQALDPRRLLAEADRLAWLSNWPKALTLYARAEQLSARTGDRRDKLYAECGRLRAEMDAGSWANISNNLTDALEDPIAQSDPRLMLRCLTAKGDVAREDDPESARDAWEKALDLAKDLGDSGWQSRAKAELAVIYFMDGESEEARGLLRDAMISAVLHVDVPTLAIYAAMICAGDTEMGEADDALGYCDKALKLTRTVKDMGYLFEAYGAKGRALMQLGHHREAQQLLEGALVKTRELDMRLEESQTLILLGKNSEGAGDLPQAIRYLEQAADLSRANGFQHSIAWSTYEASQAYRTAGDLQKAEERESQAMRAMARVGDRYHLPIHLALLADLKAKRGKFAEADQLYDRAADVVEGILAGSPNDQVQTMIANMGEVYVGHFALAAGELRNTRKAYQVLEAARGRSIANMLWERPLKNGPPDPMAASAKKEVNQIQLELLLEINPDSRSKLLDRLFEAEQILTPGTKPRTQLQETARHPHPVDLARLQSSLRADEMVLEYVLGTPQSFCLRITRHTAAVSELPAGRTQIERLVDNYLDAIRSLKPSTESSQKLYSLLLQPILGQTSKTRLIIVPDGKLNVLPFDALQDSQGRYVLASHIVTYAPSATVLHTIRTSPVPHEPSFDLLGVGDIDYQRASPLRASITQGRLRPVATDSFDLSGARLVSLPKTRDEIMAVNRALGGESRLLLGDEATEASFKSQPLADFKIIHIAAHSIVSTEFPNRSALVLGTDPASREDGLLQVSEIESLTLNAQLVTLSACDTGLGKLEGEEGIANLVRAFLLAGAKSVLASLWTASDVYTSNLMGRFYRHLAEGQDEGEALRQAKLDLVTEFGDQALPFFWAGFALVGEGSTGISHSRLALSALR